MREVGDEEGGEQDEDKQAAHILDIQSLLPVEAVGMLNAGILLPLIIDEPGLSSIGDREGSEQDESGVILWLMDHQRPHRRRRARRSEP